MSSGRIWIVNSAAREAESELIKRIGPSYSPQSVQQKRGALIHMPAH